MAGTLLASRGLRTATVALAASVVTFTGSMMGAGRAFGYDAAVTMDLFVSGPPSWVLTRQHVWNNHPWFSLVESLVFDVTGGGEVAMRVAPALFAAVTVGLVVWRVGERWSTRAGVAAGMVLASSPLFAPLARDVRGYSLATLGIVVMGVAVFDSSSPRWFGVAAAVGIGTHLYALVPFVALLGWLAADHRLDSRWRNAAIAGGLGGLLAYLWMLPALGGDGGRVFRPGWPVDAAWALFGGTVVAVVATGVLVVMASRTTRMSRPLIAVLAVIGAAVLAVWLIGPPDLYPRFVYWLVPGVAVTAGWAVHQQPRAILVAGVASAAALAPQLNGWASDALPNRKLGRRVSGSVCFGNWQGEALRFYLPEGRTGTDCDTVALLMPDRTPEETRAARERWPEVCWATTGAEWRALPGRCP